MSGAENGEERSENRVSGSQKTAEREFNGTGTEREREQAVFFNVERQNDRSRSAHMLRL